MTYMRAVIASIVDAKWDEAAWSEAKDDESFPDRFVRAD
jgi:hypothetical protein